MTVKKVNKKILRKLGYKADQQGIINRYLRGRGQWDKTTGHKSLLYTALPRGQRPAEWTWKFDSSGEYYQGKNVIFGVKALDLVKK
ncbi:MAG: hypothetical protein ACQERS_12660 [Bacteroidota bacterium]